MCAVMMMIPMMTAIMMIVRTKQILTRTGTVMAISRCAFSLASKAAHGQGSRFQHTAARVEPGWALSQGSVHMTLASGVYLSLIKADVRAGEQQRA